MANMDETSLSLEGLRVWISSPIFLVMGAFQLWMLIHAVRSGEWVWALMIFLFPPLTAVLYFFLAYRASAGSLQGFELPGSHDRRRIKELEAKIHHLDKAHHHLELGDIYFQHGKLDKAEGCYRSTLEREPGDIFARAHLGQCLLRKKQFSEALTLLEGVCAEDPKHDYGHSLMALAEARSASQDKDGAIAAWVRVTENHSYARARVQLAELYLEKGRSEEARGLLEEVIRDASHGPAFDRKRERPWVQRARKLLRRA